MNPPDRPGRSALPTAIAIRHLHEWDIDSSEAVRIQQQLAGRVILRDEYPGRRIRRIAGADIAGSRNDRSLHAAVVIFDFETMELVEEAKGRATARFPYIPGLLSFREVPALLDAFATLRTAPDMVICDGQGIAHPRRFGLASHLGIILDIPTIGCAKKRLLGTHTDVGPLKGDASPLNVGGDIIGTVLRTKDRVRPLYVSPGHRISRAAASEVVLACCRGYRLPEPTRQAHLAVSRYRRESMNHTVPGET